MRLLRDRRGVSEAVVYALLLATVIAIGGFIVMTVLPRIGGAATQQAVLQVVGTPTIQDDGTNAYVYFTVRNIGTAPATIVKVAYKGSEASVTAVSGSTTLNPGASGSYKATFGSGTFPNVGEGYQLTLITDKGTIMFTAYRQQ